MIELNTLGAAIKETYEAEANTNAFTDLDKQHLDEMFARSSFSGSFTDLSNVPNFLLESRRAAANGVASLDATGKVPMSQLNVSGLQFKGAWNPNTNIPAILDGTGTIGDFYKASTAGSFNSGNGNFTYAVGDWVIYAGGIWQRLGSADTVSMVNGQLGNVVLTAASVGARADTWVPSWGEVTGKPTFNAAYVGAKPSTYVPAWSEVTGKPDFPAAYVAKRGIIGVAVPALAARQTVNADMPNANLTQMPWNTILYDQFGMVISGNVGAYTVPSWAKYAKVTGALQFLGNGTGERQVSVRINGANKAGFGITRQNVPGANAFVLNFITGVMPVTSGEIISTAIYQSSGVVLPIQGSLATFLQIELHEGT